MAERIEVIYEAVDKLSAPTRKATASLGKMQAETTGAASGLAGVGSAMAALAGPAGMAALEIGAGDL